MVDTTNLELRGRKFWVTRTVPRSLRKVVGKAALRRNLGTSDLAEALRLKPLALADFAQELELARKKVAVSPDPVAERALAWKRFASEAVSVTGLPLKTDVKAALLVEEAIAVQAQFGPEEAARFQAIVHTETGTPLDFYFEAFQAESKITLKTKAEQKTAMRRLVAHSPRATLAKFGREAAADYIRTGMTYTDHPVSKNKAISYFSSYWRYLLRRGKVSDNPWRDQFLKTQRGSDEDPEPAERAFTASEMVALFSGDPDPALRDIMAIAALSGMRRDEICMLLVRDCDGGEFNIRKSKTKSGIRKVPIHSALVPLVAARIRGKRPDEFLIEELGPAPPASALRGRGSPISKRFRTYREGVGVAEVIDGARRSKVNLHSFRRWFCTQAERAGIEPHIIEAVVGHKRLGQSLGTYSAGPSIDQRRACIESVSLPDGCLVVRK